MINKANRGKLTKMITPDTRFTFTYIELVAAITNYQNSPELGEIDKSESNKLILGLFQSEHSAPLIDAEESKTLPMNVIKSEPEILQFEVVIHLFDSSQTIEIEALSLEKAKEKVEPTLKISEWASYKQVS